MSDNLRSFLRDERQRLVNYVRSLIAETASMDAEDIVQDVIVKLVERRDDLPPLEGLGAYTYRSLRNRVIDRRRTERDLTSLDSTMDEQTTLLDILAGDGPEPDWLMQSEQGRELLFEGLNRLKDIEREVVIAFELELIPFSELSERMNMPVNTLISHKARGLKKLKSYFAEVNGD